MKLEENIDKLEVKITCDKVEQFLWIHDIAEGVVKLANNDLIVTTEDIDPKFKELFGKAIKNME